MSKHRTGPLSGFTLIELLIVILIISVLMSLVLAALWQADRSSRNALFERYVTSDLPLVIQQYSVDNNCYPPGDGTGSADLMKALQKQGAGHVSYLPSSPELDAAGNLVNLVRSGDFVRFRNNAARRGDPASHNKGRFDLWCRDINGKPEGIRNW